MNDIDLLKKLQNSSFELKLQKLLDLKGRIQTDVFLCEIKNSVENISEHKRHLEYVQSCIDKFKKKILTPDDMKEMNFLDKKYKRI